MLPCPSLQMSAFFSIFVSSFAPLFSIQSLYGTLLSGCLLAVSFACALHFRDDWNDDGEDDRPSERDVSANTKSISAPFIGCLKNSRTYIRFVNGGVLFSPRRVFFPVSVRQSVNQSKPTGIVNQVTGITHWLTVDRHRRLRKGNKGKFLVYLLVHAGQFFQTTCFDQCV